MKILVDADACPVKREIMDVAARQQVPVVLVASVSHNLEPSPGVEVVRVDNIPEAADIALANRAQSGDIVVTDDYGVACMLLGKRVLVLSSRGVPFEESTIDALMESRHTSARARRGGGRTPGSRPFTRQDSEKFRRQLEAWVT